MNTIAIELKLPSQQYAKLESAAQVQQLSVADIAQVAIEEWLERQARMTYAKHLMRELGKGLGESRTSYDVARNHDAYLYTREQE